MMSKRRLQYYGRMARHYLTDPSSLAHEVASARRRNEVTRARLKELPEAASGTAPVIVSLTSYGKRIRRVHVAIRSIMHQTVRPNKVLLWLGEDSDDQPIPVELAELVPLGLEIRRGVEDLKGHKKYLFAMRELSDSDCLLVTIDDDLVYARDTIQTLLAAHALYPHHVVARRTHRILTQGDEVLPYVDWQMEFREGHPVPRRSLLATTGAGTLYPSELFGRLAGDPADIRSTALSMDDLWLKALETSQGLDVVYAPNAQPMPFVLPFSQGEGLLHDNKDGGNDGAMQRLMAHFGLSARDFVDDGAEG